MKDQFMQKAFIENWRREMEAAQLYEQAAEGETDPKRKAVLQQLADVERRHAQMWARKLEELGVPPGDLPVPTPRPRRLTRNQLIEQIEQIEKGNADWYRSLRNVFSEPGVLELLDQIEADERAHGDIEQVLTGTPGAMKRLTHIWRNERWHKQGSGGWIGDAIYGVNDGLGAIFGIIAGVAGYTSVNSHDVLVSGFFGALASTLSMGAGAYLATKSENEVMEKELASERQEIAQDPEHEIEELALLYQLKGFSEEEANQIAHQIAQDPEQFLKTMAQEELGIHEVSRGNPWTSALFGSLSTFVGGIIPLIPFFFLQGTVAMVLAAVISILAHFVVGALKSIVTVRSWWVSGLEMTLVGVIVGLVSYGLGLFGAKIL